MPRPTPAPPIGDLEALAGEDAIEPTPEDLPGVVEHSTAEPEPEIDEVLLDSFRAQVEALNGPAIESRRAKPGTPLKANEECSFILDQRTLDLLTVFKTDLAPGDVFDACADADGKTVLVDLGRGRLFSVDEADVVVIDTPVSIDHGEFGCVF